VCSDQPEKSCDSDADIKKEGQPGAQGDSEKTGAAVDELEQVRDCNTDIKHEGQPDVESVA